MEVGQGIVAGGHGYVVAAYTISWVVFIAYTLHAVLQAHAATRRTEESS